MAEDDRRDEDAPLAPLPPGVPRPPSRADVDRVSEAQGMITDEWGGEPDARRPARTPTERGGEAAGPEEEAEGHPS